MVRVEIFSLQKQENALTQHVWSKSQTQHHAIPANTKRNKYVIITSKRRVDVKITCLLHCVFAGVVVAAVASHILLDKPGTHFTNDSSITIQIRWKINLALIQLQLIISQQNLVHATTAKLSCHVPNFVAITLLVLGWEQNEISITFE